MAKVIMFIIVLILFIVWILCIRYKLSIHNLNKEYYNFPIHTNTHLQKNKIITRESVKNYCDYVIDVIYNNSYAQVSVVNPNFSKTWKNFYKNVLPRLDTHVKIYIPNVMLNKIYQSLLNRLKSPITIFCDEGDVPVYTNVIDILHKNKFIKQLYINNLELDIDINKYRKLKHIPLGYRKNTTEGLLLLKKYFISVYYPTEDVIRYLNKHKITPFHEKQKKILVAIGSTGSKWTSVSQRKECKKYLQDKSFAYSINKKVNQTAYYKLHNTYAFEISPMGNGVDCYRHYETLLLETIPIIFDSYMNKTFANLPVLIIKDVREITDDLLHTTFEKYKDWFRKNNIRDFLKLDNFI
jgi:hypothetical protein